MDRPPVAVVVCAGVVLGLLAVDGGVATTLAVPASLTAAAILPRARGLRTLSLAAALGVVAGARAEASPREDALSASLADGTTRLVVEGTVLSSEPPAPAGAAFVLGVESFTDAAGRHDVSDADVRVRAFGGASSAESVEGFALHPGDRVTVAGLASRIPPATNPGEFDRRAAWERRGVHARLLVPDAAGVERLRASDGPLALVSQARHAAARRLDLTIGRDAPEDAGLLRSLVLGDRGALSPADRRRFQRAGAAHILAISGTHVALLVAALLAVLRRARVPPRVAAAIVLAAIAVLVPFTGSAAPVVRSAAGFSMFLVGRLLGREPSGGVLLASVAAAFLVVDPDAAKDPGFRMSFAAAAGLVLLAGRIRRALLGDRVVLLPGLGPPPRAPVRSALAAGIAAWAGSTPVAVHDLGQMGLVAIPVGLVAVPLSSLAMLVGCVASLLDGLPLAGPASRAALDATLWLLRAVLDVPAAVGLRQDAVAPPPGLWYAAYVVAFAVAARASRGAAVTAAATLAVLLLSLHRETPHEPPPWPRVTLLDVGHGQAAVLETPDGQAALLDAGSLDRDDVGARVVVPALRAMSIDALDLLVASHADSDHAGAIADVLDEMPGAVFAKPPRFAPEVAAPIEARVGATLEAADGDVLMAGPWGRLRVLGPARSPPARASTNDRCLVLSLETSHGIVLLPGDRETRGVADLLDAHRGTHAPRADVLVLPHHGHPSAGLTRLVRECGAVTLLASGPPSEVDRLPAGTRATGREGALVVDLAPGGPFVTRAAAARGARGGQGDGYDRAPSAAAAPASVGPMPDAPTLAIAAAVLLAISWSSVRLRWLEPPAAVAAGVLGLLAVSAFSWAGLAGLLAPFLVATLLGKAPGGLERSGPRSLRQVVANGAAALLGIALAFAGRRGEGAIAFAGALAALGADTIATEVGTRWGGVPRHALSMRPLARGESGGVTIAGLLASVGGAALAPAAMAACGALRGYAVPVAVVAGVVAGYADSVLGALVQRKGRCGTCGKTVEAAVCCGAAPERLPGRLSFLDNDAVNLANGVVGALVAWLLTS